MSLLKTAGTVLLSGVIGYGGCILVNLGYDWGYLYANKLSWGHECNQGSMALMSLAYLIFPLLSFWTLGYLTRNATKVWTSLLLAFGGLAVLYPNLPVDGSFLLNAIWALAAGVTAGLSFFASHKLFKFLQRRLDPTVIFRPAAFVFTAASASALALTYFDSKLPQSPGFELALYSGAVMLIAHAASRCAHPKGTIGGAFAGVLATSPLLLANALNVGGNMLSLGLDNIRLGADLGPSALVSALLISLSAIAASILGGAIGAMTFDRNADLAASHSMSR
jgi:hypothetical protein